MITRRRSHGTSSQACVSKGGAPWGPVGLLPGSCYVEVSFCHSLGSEAPTMQTSMVRAFNEDGDALVLRGPDFEWDSEKNNTNSPTSKA